MFLRRHLIPGVPCLGCPVGIGTPGVAVYSGYVETPDSLVSSVRIFLLRVAAIGGGGAPVRSCCEAPGEGDRGCCANQTRSGAATLLSFPCSLVGTTPS